MSTHINMGTGLIWVRCHAKLLMTKFFHLILILKTQPFTKSKIEYLSFGCEGHWQYFQISYRSIEYHCNLPKLSLTYIFVTEVFCGSCWGPLSRRVFYVCKSFFCTCAKFSLKEGERASLWDLLTDLDKSSHHSLVDLKSLLKTWTCLTWPLTRWAYCCSGWEGVSTPEVEQL